MSDREINPAQPQVEPHTRRERDILALLAQGHPGPEIAEKLTLAVSSVKWHTRHVDSKLGVDSKRQALTRHTDLGLLATLATPAALDAGPAPASLSHLRGSAACRLHGFTPAIASRVG